MRMILFRGKICRDCKGVTTQKKYKEGDWAFGDLSHTNYNTPLIDQSNDDPVPVDPDTVGQYTGLLDKNGKRIFEGDICRNTKTGEIVLVKWHGTMAGFVWNKRKENSHLSDFGELFRVYDKYEVIGNIHDNPELMDGGAADED